MANIHSRLLARLVHYIFIIGRQLTLFAVFCRHSVRSVQIAGSRRPEGLLRLAAAYSGR